MTARPLRARDLLHLSIDWRETKPGTWVATVDGVECVLTMNDFPDEPLYTVHALGETFDLDDPPSAWRIEFKCDT